MENEKKAKKILIVEDDLNLQRVIKTLFDDSNFYTLTARSIEEAKTQIQREAIDIIWLDHYLLGAETGLDFVTYLKENDRLKVIPIFVVSNTATPDKKAAYLQLGVNKFYTKVEHSLEEIIQEIIKTT